MSALADRFRREGMADAAVLLVAHRIHPTTDLDAWGRALGLEHRELVAAVDRFKERARAQTGRPGKAKRYRGPAVACTVPGCGVSAVSPQGLAAHLRSHEQRTCEWCGGIFNRLGLGPHKRSCEQRPGAA